MQSASFYFYSFLVILILVVDINGRDVIVTTRTGKVRGRKAQTVGLNTTYYAYEGIPYAKPPVGNLRFEPPEPALKWSGTFDATKDGNICVQSTNPVLGSEDCLNLNVYVPNEPKWLGLLPTMVFFYGGGFEAGFATYDLYGPDYLLDKDVVVVTFNYRVGIFGFLSTGDLVVPGNNGLKDQVMALKWVRDNIQNFGGDPKRVTIFGQSAGSASVSYQMSSPLSRGLFHGAIMESGVSLSLWAFSRVAPEMTKKVAKKLSINTGSSISIAEGLKRVGFEALQIETAAVLGAEAFTHNPRDGFQFGPIIEQAHENAFLSKKSHQMLVDGDFAKVPCIVGYNSLEGTFKFGTLFRLFLFQYDINPKKLLPFDLNLYDEFQKSRAATELKSFYFGFKPVALSNFEVMSYLSDDQFVRPIREYVRLISKHVPTYYYRFSYEGNLWGITNRTQPGVGHSEELGYIWRSKFDEFEHDKVTRKRLVNMWTNFAKTGNPTPRRLFPTADEVTVWNRADHNFAFLDIGKDLVMKTFPSSKSMNFWDNLYRKYGTPPYDTY